MNETCLYCHCNITRGQGVKWDVEFRCLEVIFKAFKHLALS